MAARQMEQATTGRIALEPLTAEAFAPFGDVLAPPETPGRIFFDEALANAREQASPSLSISRVAPRAAGPFVATIMERHAFSSQSFVALSAKRWLAIVAPADVDGRPDMARLRAFVAGPEQGVTYRASTWHHPLTVLDAPAIFAVFMWRDGTAGDEEFLDVAPVTINLDRESLSS